MKKFYIGLILFLSITIITNGQNQSNSALDSSTIILKDTTFNIVFDSVDNHMGLINPDIGTQVLVKYFKYIGTDTIFLSPWTGDPHFICGYPKGPLVPHKLYSFKVQFSHRGRKGRLKKQMGFNLSDGNRITLRFTGEYLPVEGN